MNTVRLSAFFAALLCGGIALSASGAAKTGISPVGTHSREEIVSFFKDNVFGRRPACAEKPFALRFEPASEDKAVATGMIRRQGRVVYGGPCGTNSFVVTAFLPTESGGPAPAFLYLCTRRDYEEYCDPERERKSGDFPVEEIVARGFAAVSFHCWPVAPDYNNGNTEGVFACFEKSGPCRNTKLWGTLSAWAWGASRALDWLETIPQVDASKVAIVGHSRGGKTALWAAVTDERFAMACVNGSGCCGARLNHVNLPRRERFADIVTRFQYWFCLDFTRWVNRDMEMPFDQHELLACVAPRLLAVGSGSEDAWACPEGERKATELARAAWGEDGYLVSYHSHKGGHKLCLDDWNVYLSHAEKYLKGSVSVPCRETRDEVSPQAKEGPLK